MPDFRAIERLHVLDAIEAYEKAGGAVFMAIHGFSPSEHHQLLHAGTAYDARAIVGLAYGLAAGRTLSADEIQLADASRVLRRLEFDVSGGPAPQRAATRTPAPRGAAGSASTRTTRTAPKPRVAKSDAPPPPVCPTCHMAIPATGICDNCG